jgi:murein DD-endopeptidase MepM/ murein hydrolase activator NlpD
MVTVSGLLIMEYSFFKRQTEQLEHLKDDYAHYVSMLKKLILEHGITKDSGYETIPSDAHRVNSEPECTEPQFLVVNREPAYLKKSALSFARLHNLEWALRKMYASDEWVARTTRVKKASVKSMRQPRRKSRTIAQVQPKSLEKAWRALQREPLFIWPIDRLQFWLSSPFGPRKKGKSWEFHTGIDMAAMRGTAVKAGGTGIVTQATYASGYGNTIVITHNRKFKTRYAHLDKILVIRGQRVNQGDIIGKVGSTGCVRKSKRGSDPSHLHFEVYVFNKRVNPFYFLA